MKKILSFFYIIPAAGLLLFTSCSKQIDEAYTNPNAGTRVPVEELLPGIIANMSTQYAAAGTGYGPQNDGLYVGRYVQYWFTNGNGNQYDQMGGATGTSDVLGAIWAMNYYGQGQNLVDMLNWSTEEEKWDYRGVGLAIRAWAWLTLTDMHGEVILREAFDKFKRVFQYDEQKDVYAEVKRLAFEALDNLNRTDGKVSQANLAKGDAWMNNGDVNKWKKFVYALLACVHHRVTNKAEYKADSVIKYCNLAMQTNAENTSLKWSNAGGTGTYSYYAPFRGNVGTLRQSRFVANLLSGGNSLFSGVADPRAWYLIRENKNGTFKGILPNRGDSATYPAIFDLAPLDRPFNFWGQEYKITTAPSTDATCRYIFTNAPIWPIYSAAMMKFTKAEALFRKGLRAEAMTAYTEGINLNFDQLISDYQTNVPTANRITPAARTAYITDPKVTPTLAEFSLAHIMLQKYIATYGWGFVETWVDMRRFHYTDKETDTNLPVYRDLQPPTGSDLFTTNNGNWVYRARPRYNSEYLYNVNELNRIGALATDYNTKKMWFSEP